MGVVLEVIIWFFAHIIGEVIVGSVLEMVGQSRRPRLAKNEMLSDIRAVYGRVYDMGTEWSSGTAIVSAGHISFHPTMGIVGSREIDVDVVATGSLGLSRVSRRRPLVTVITLVTPDGRLEWAVDTDRLGQASDLLRSQGTTEVGVDQP